MRKLEKLVPPLDDEHREQWETIPNYSNYQVSNTGKVRSINYNRTGICKELKFWFDKLGYARVVLTKNGKCITFLVHRLVAMVFLDNPENKAEVDHIDTNPSNNNVSNLRWCTGSENKMNPLTRKRNSTNNRWKGKTGSLMHNSKAVRCVDTGEIFGSMTEAERITGIRHESISACCCGKISTAGGFLWTLA